MRLDLDGALHPHVLGILLLDDLSAAGVCGGAPTARLFDFLRSLDQERLHAPESVRTAYELYARALRGCAAGLVREVAGGLWRREAANVFAYAVPLLERLRRGGVTLPLVSGSPQEIVERVGRGLGCDRWRGAVLAEDRGVYTGEYARMPAMARQKLALATDLVGGPEYLAQCGAVGNSVLLTATATASGSVAVPSSSALLPVLSSASNSLPLSSSVALRFFAATGAAG